MKTLLLMRFLGGINSAALLKFMQTNEFSHHHHLKMAIVSEHSSFIQPQSYFGVAHSHQAQLKLESNTVSAQVDNWSKIEVNTKVTKIDAAHDRLELNNGKVFSYKALVLTPGFDHSSSFIKGLDTLEKTPEEDGVFCHVLDHKQRVSRNFYNGWNNKRGDLICYSPKFPYKGEGTDFYALYYEHFMRQDQI